MTIIEYINIILTVVSIAATIVSIRYSILSCKSAKAAKRYKEETLKFKEALDLRSLLNQFMLESQNYQNRTRDLNWYKGQDANLVINPFNKVLLSFGEYYHLMENANEMKSKVHSLQNVIQPYTRFTKDVQKEINNLITGITELLQEETRKRTSEIIIDH